MLMERVIVAGGGMAGLRTAEALRAHGYEGRVMLLAAEDRPPYDRPPLSKEILLGKRDDSALAAPPPDVELLLGRAATGLAPGVVRTDAGDLGCDAVVIATGAEPIRLPGDGPQHVLRTIGDALRLRAELRPGRRVAVVGAGWIGAEVATAAARAGCAVTVVEAGNAPLAVAVGEDVGRRTEGWYAEAGVTLRTGAAVAAVRDGGLELADGGTVPAEVVVSGIGVRPAVGWLAGSGLELGDGVHVDAYLRAAEGVYAVGDCAAFVSRRYGRRLRIEHWDTAVNAPEVVAANLTGGGPDGPEAYDPVPYVWSEQFGRMLQYAGRHDPASVPLWRGDPADGSWSAFWLTGERLAAMLTVDRPRDLVQARRLMRRGARVDPARLADPELPVKAAEEG
ncbi:MAG: NAD(P)/FAD-dependent oxidoreductase [Streptosporangiales bacterium]|nr:NAD(P)/FAD-dependent oxidoreductase [Streptosporangiales bacterium]